MNSPWSIFFKRALRKEKKMTDFLNFPSGVYQEILKYLDDDDCRTLKYTCRYIRNIVIDNRPKIPFYGSFTKNELFHIDNRNYVFTLLMEQTHDQRFLRLYNQWSSSLGYLQRWKWAGGLLGILIEREYGSIQLFSNHPKPLIFDFYEKCSFLHRKLFNKFITERTYYVVDRKDI